jgi:hypothetical protein
MVHINFICPDIKFLSLFFVNISFHLYLYYSNWKYYQDIYLFEFFINNGFRAYPFSSIVNISSAQQKGRHYPT